MTRRSSPQHEPNPNRIFCYRRSTTGTNAEHMERTWRERERESGAITTRECTTLPKRTPTARRIHIRAHMHCPREATFAMRRRRPSRRSRRRCHRPPGPLGCPTMLGSQQRRGHPRCPTHASCRGPHTRSRTRPKPRTKKANDDTHRNVNYSTTRATSQFKELTRR